MEINLLPWREQRRQARRKFIVVLGIVTPVMLGLIWWIYFAKATPDSITTIHSLNTAVAVAPEQPLPGIKFVGLLRQGARTWGLLMFADGTTRDVQVGTKIFGVNAWVVSINASELVVKLSNQHHYVMKMESTPHPSPAAPTSPTRGEVKSG